MTSSLDALGLHRESGFRQKINKFLSHREEVLTIHAVKPRLSYSQFGEDAVLQSFISDLPGFYIDIGSGHPVVGSNTFALYQRGWNGILIDPVLSNIALSREIRANDTAIQAAVSNSSTQTLEFIEFSPYQYSTTSGERAKEIEALGHHVVGIYPVEVRKLSEILPAMIPAAPTVLSIDVEGNELDVLLSNDWSTFKPDYILVEEFEHPWTGRTEVRELLESMNYTLKAVCGVTCLYIKQS